MKKKEGNSHEISPPEARWLLQETMQPLQASTLNPCRAVRNCSGVKEEGRTYADHQVRLQHRQIPEHESVLLGRTETDPDDVWPQRLNLCRKLTFFLFRHWPEWRRVGSDDGAPGEAAQHLVA